MRCVYLENHAQLIGFTVKNGYAHVVAVRYDGYGGGVLASEGSLVRDCVIISNSARYGGGVMVASDAAVESSVIRYNGAEYGGNVCLGNGRVDNCLIANGGAVQGGGVYIGSTGCVRQCTLIGNHGLGGGACIYAGTIENSILWSNNCGSGEDIPSANWEDFNHGGMSLLSCCTFPLPGGAGCMTNAPAFLDESIGDYRLAVNSPCIDTGMELSNITSDLNGTPRPLDGDGNGVAGYDMGAYEFIFGTADSDRDGMADGDELTAGFSPLDGQSVFCMDEMLPDQEAASHGLLVRWSSAAGKYYNVLRSTNLAEGFAPCSTNLPATPPMNVFTDSTASAGSMYFYRVELED